MGGSTLLSSEDKAKVKKAVPTSSSTNKIICGTVARVYQAKAGAPSCVSFSCSRIRDGRRPQTVDGVLWMLMKQMDIRRGGRRPGLLCGQGEGRALVQGRWAHGASAAGTTRGR